MRVAGPAVLSLGAVIARTSHTDWAVQHMLNIVTILSFKASTSTVSNVIHGAVCLLVAFIKPYTQNLN